MIKETPAEAGEAMERAEAALREAERAYAKYLDWMADWRYRNEYHGPFDPQTGFPLKDEAAE